MVLRNLRFAMKLKWILRDSNLYILILFFYFGTTITNNISYLFIAFGIAHLNKIYKAYSRKILYVSNFNTFITIVALLILVLDAFKKTNFSYFFIFLISLKELLFTKYTTSIFTYYANKFKLTPDFMVVVQNDLKEYLFRESSMPVSYYFYMKDVEFVIDEKIKGIKTSEHFIPFHLVQNYCTDSGIAYNELSLDHVENMKMIQY